MASHTKVKTFSRTRIAILCVMLLAVAGVTAALRAQSGRSYGPDRIWWTAGSGDILPWQEDYDDADGQVGIYNANGMVRTQGHPFFESLGENGRACVTCHQPSNAMSVATAAIQERWRATAGQDAIFEAIDGANCPDLPQMSQSSHSLLLRRGLFRIALPWPPRDADGAPMRPEFRIEVVRDPTGCNVSPVYGLHSAKPAVSVFRRPRVAANLKYVVSSAGSALMADGRAPTLEYQATDAALTHEQATRPSPEQLQRIIQFESQVYTAQISDIRGGLLGEKSGPSALGLEHVASGAAGVLNGAAPPAGSALSQDFGIWRKPPGATDVGLQREFRASVARGSEVFFARTFLIRGTYPLNPAGAGGRPVSATCATCHTEGMTRWMDIGTANRRLAEADPDLPLFKITCDVSPAAAHPFLGRVIYTSDPGRALITGKCADVGSIVMQQFRGLAARAPYFANGSAATLRDLVDFYDQRFEARFTKQEKQDLVNFLKVL